MTPWSRTNPLLRPLLLEFQGGPIQGIPLYHQTVAAFNTMFKSLWLPPPPTHTHHHHQTTFPSSGKLLTLTATVQKEKRTLQSVFVCLVLMWHYLDVKWEQVLMAMLVLGQHKSQNTQTASIAASFHCLWPHLSWRKTAGHTLATISQRSDHFHTQDTASESVPTFTPMTFHTSYQ